MQQRKTLISEEDKINIKIWKLLQRQTLSLPSGLAVRISDNCWAHLDIRIASFLSIDLAANKVIKSESYIKVMNMHVVSTIILIMFTRNYQNLSMQLEARKRQSWRIFLRHSVVALLEVRPF